MSGLGGFIGVVGIGLLAGVLSGLIGIGGGIVLIPALVFIFGMPQPLAQGTTLAAMVPPIGILAAYVYYKNGQVDLKVASWIALGFVFGGAMGAYLANLVSKEMLSRIFATVLIFIGIKMLLKK